jgi:hypothetical protein
VLAFIFPLPRAVALRSERRSSSRFCLVLDSLGGADQRPPGFQATRFFRVVAKRVVANAASDIAKRPGRADGKWSAQLSYLAKP